MRRSLKHRNSYDQETDSDDQYDFSSRKRAKVQPRFIKNQIDDIDTDVIVVNISKTQYPIIEQIALQLGWQVDTARKSQVWDIMWTDTHIEAHDLFKLNQHQKISHYPSIQVLTRKNLLAKSLAKMSKLFPNAYNFFPFTWNIPSQFTELYRYNQKLKEDQKQASFYIYKPQALAQGKGIKICDQLDSLQGKNGIVQIYINNPFLIQKLKFDLRIYVLIIGLNPIRIFIYDEGLGRFATSKYEKANSKNAKDNCMHLTNYAINRKNKNFIFNTSQKDMNKGHKRSLSAIYNYLSKKGTDIQLIKQRIDEIIIKTLLVGEPMLKHTYNLSRSVQNIDDVCFQILGFDVLINENLQPILLQVNHTPSFKTDTPLDRHIKKNLIKDTLKLLNLNIDKKKQIIQLKRQRIEMRSQRKITKLNSNQKQILKAEKIKKRDQYQEQNLGNFRKIYPLKDSQNKYNKFRSESERIFVEQNGLKNRGQLRQRLKKRPNSFGKPQSQLQNKITSKQINRTMSMQTTPIQKKPSKQIQKISMLELHGLKDKFPTLSLLKKNQTLLDYGSNLEVQSAIFSRKNQKLKESKNETNNMIFSQMKMSQRGAFLAPKVLGLQQISFGKKKNKPQRQKLVPSPALVKKSQKKIPIHSQKFREKIKYKQYKSNDDKISEYKNLIGSLIGNLNQKNETINKNNKFVKTRYNDEFMWDNK